MHSSEHMVARMFLASKRVNSSWLWERHTQNSRRLSAVDTMLCMNWYTWPSRPSLDSIQLSLVWICGEVVSIIIVIRLLPWKRRMVSESHYPYYNHITFWSRTNTQKETNSSFGLTPTGSYNSLLWKAWTRQWQRACVVEASLELQA